MPAVLGDFLAAAGEHLEAAVVVGDGQVTQLPEIARELHCLVVVMSRYLDDLAPFDEAGASGRTDLRAWERVASMPMRPCTPPRTISAGAQQRLMPMRTRRHHGGHVS